ncbi:MAG: hypothetical protein WD492_00080 [Alkalispirochaeta sp.]
MIEVKARFPLAGGKRRRLDLFAYSPVQLQINQRSLPRERFLSGVISHARYQVRREGLDILTSDDSDNPLWRLERAGERDPSYEIRMVCNLFHSAFKEELRDAVSAGGGLDQVVTRGRTVLNRCERVLARFEECAQPAREYLWGTTARRVARTILSEESKRASSGEGAAAGVTTVGGVAEAGASTAAPVGGVTARDRELLREWLRELEETAERWGVVTLHADPEQVARDAELKKWVQSILYLPGRESNRNQRVFQAIAAVAAGLAMTVAVVATVFAEARWSGGSLPWALALIGAYIVKDRVKEGTRAVLVRRVPGLVQDRVTLLSEPDDGVRSPRRRVVARRVAVLRFPDAPGGWSCVQLQKRFTFRLRRMSRHRRVDAVVEVLRVDVSDWLQRMDRAWKYWPRRTDAGELELASVSREYTLYAQVDIDGTETDWYRITATRQEITDITALPEAPFGAPARTSGSAPPRE